METFTYSLSDDKMIMPSQMQLTKAQQEVLKYQEYATQPPNSSLDQELRLKSQTLAELLRKDKEQAKLKIDELVASARQMTSELTHSLTAVPVHPYQRLIYDYLGPNFICPSIHELTIPDNFSPARCLVQLEQVAQKTSENQLAQYRVLSAEAMDTSFFGITSENLNNAFAVLSSTSQGDQFIIDKEKLKQHLAFAEMVKNIPTDYIIENPLIVAKKLLAEFTRIHYTDNATEETSMYSQTTNNASHAQTEERTIEQLARESANMLNKMLVDYDTKNLAEDFGQKPLAEQVVKAKQTFLK